MTLEMTAVEQVNLKKQKKKKKKIVELDFARLRLYFMFLEPRLCY